MNKFRAMLGNAAYSLGNALNWAASKTPGTISLAPTYLSGLLWLISQKFRDLAKEGFGGNAAVFSCLRFLCQSIAEPPLIAYTQTADGEQGDPLAYSHPLRQLIKSPCPFLTEYEMWELVTQHIGIVGRSVWWKERDNAGRIINLWPLRPDRVGPIYGNAEAAQASGNSADTALLGWSYQVPGTSRYIPIHRDDTVLYNIPDPLGESGGLVEGLGPLQVLAAEVGADNEATKFVGATISNYAMPGMVVEVQTPVKDPATMKVLKAALTQEFGQAGRGKVMVIDAGSKASSFGFTMQELEFPSLRKISESRIASAFQTPAILVGLLVGLEAGIRATIAEQRELFTETTCAGYWRRYGDVWSNQVAPEYGQGIICGFDTGKVKALAAQTVARTTLLAEVAKIGNVVTINELRAAVDLPERPDGDEYIGAAIVAPDDPAKMLGSGSDDPPAAMVPNGRAKVAANGR